MVTMETIRGWKEKNVSLLAARRHPYHFLVPMLICRKTVPGGHDIVSLDIIRGSIHLYQLAKILTTGTG